MNINNSLEDEYATAWFDDFKDKLNVLLQLSQLNLNSSLDKQSRTLREEAYILCVVYLDQLSNLYKKCKHKGKWKFCDLLISYSSESLFEKIYFRQLLLELKKESEKDRPNLTHKAILEKLINFLETKNCKLNANFISLSQENFYLKMYDKNEIISMLQNDKILNNQEYALLESDMEKGRGSIASFCYVQIRNPTIHEHGPSNWNIGNIEINFDLLYAALNNIFNHIRKEYDNIKEFFGYTSFPEFLKR